MAQGKGFAFAMKSIPTEWTKFASQVKYSLQEYEIFC